MKLNHLDLQVPDVQHTARFFERYFDFEHTSNRASPAIAILSDRHGLVLVLQKLKDPAEAALSAIEQALNLDHPAGADGRSQGASSPDTAADGSRVEPRLPDVHDSDPLSDPRADAGDQRDFSVETSRHGQNRSAMVMKRVCRYGSIASDPPSKP